MNRGQLSDQELIEGYLEYMQASRRSVSTLKLRRYQLTRLSVSLQTGLLNATHDSLLRFIAESDRHSRSTVRAMRSAVSMFYKWAVAERLLDENPAARLPAISEKLPAPRPVPENVLADMLARADRVQLPIILLAAYAGLRRAEIAKVHGDDVTEQGLRVIGKGERFRVIPIHPILEPALEAQMFSRYGWLFPSSIRIGEHVSPDYVAAQIEPLLPAGYTLHKLRHRFASRTYEKTRDVFAVQQLLGHSSPQTTMRYVLIQQDHLKAAVGMI